MRIFVVGTRGIPNVPGGIEKHCEMLYPLLAQAGCDVLVATRSRYVNHALGEWQGVRLVRSSAPRIKGLEASLHTLISLIKARWYSPDIVHIHGVGPGLLTPLARLLGFRVVLTHHGPDYERQTWGRFAKFLLRSGEKVGVGWANEVIAISKVTQEIVRQRCAREANLIYNGVNIPQQTNKAGFLNEIGVSVRNYILTVARFVPEKGLVDLITAFSGVSGDFRLVIAGAADHETSYSRMLRVMASKDERIILTGYITGVPLHQVYEHARLFVLPSYHEGLPIALLEAMSHGLRVLASDIPANKEINLPVECYFRCGDVTDLKAKLAKLVEKELTESEQTQMRAQLEDHHNWGKMAQQTMTVFERAISNRSKRFRYLWQS